MGGVVPGLFMGFILMLFNWLLGRRRGYVGREKRSTASELRKGIKDAILALPMPVIIIGGIVGGVFTPTESAAIAAGYALLLGGVVYREPSRRKICEAFMDAAVMNGVIPTVLMTASLFIRFMTVKMIPQSVTRSSMNVIASKWGALMVMLIAGTFIDTIGALTIFVPLFLPLAKAFEIDPVHFGVVVAVNLTIGLRTPPLGVCLFVACGIAKTTLREMFRDLLYLLIPLLLLLLLITYVPALVTRLCRTSSGCRPAPEALHSEWREGAYRLGRAFPPFGFAAKDARSLNDVRLLSTLLSNWKICR